MTVATDGPESPERARLRLGQQLRRLRKSAGLTLEQVAVSLGVDPAKISRHETGERAPSADDVRSLCALYRVDKLLAGQLVGLAIDARVPGRHRLVTTDPDYRTFAGLEQGALAVRICDGPLLPRVLHTPEYARAFDMFVTPPHGLPLREVQIAAALPIRRRDMLTRDGQQRVHVILDEMSLWRPIGDAGVMSAQMELLLQLATDGRVTIQVVPFASGPHAGLQGRFTHLVFPDSESPDVVYVEDSRGGRLLKREADVAAYAELFRDLSERVAMTADDSVRQIAVVQQSWVRRDG